MDGYNQDCHDYFLGNLNIKKDKLRTHSMFGILILHILAIFIWFMMSKKVKNIEFGYFGYCINCGVWFVLTTIIVWGTSLILRNNFIDLHSKHN